MADHRGLGRLGWALGAVTAAVLLIAAIAVVASHSDQRPSEGASRFVAAAKPSAGAYDLGNLFHPR